MRSVNGGGRYLFHAPPSAATVKRPALPSTIKTVCGLKAPHDIGRVALIYAACAERAAMIPAGDQGGLHGFALHKRLCDFQDAVNRPARRGDKLIHKPRRFVLPLCLFDLACFIKLFRVLCRLLRPPDHAVNQGDCCIAGVDIDVRGSGAEIDALELRTGR